MRKFIGGLLILGSWLVMSVKPAVAQTSLAGYSFESFDSQIEILQNTKLRVAETVKVSFLEQRHGIYRYIPNIYRYNGKMLAANIRVIGVKDEKGRVTYKTSKSGNNLVIRIGDEDKLVLGNKTYEITYEVENMIARFEDHDELYWNVVGSKWDTNAKKVTAEVISNFATITKTECFADVFGGSAKNCYIEGTESNKRAFESSIPVGKGSDLTIVVGLDKDNKLVWPTWQSRLWEQIWLRWYYLFFVLPTVFIGRRWWKRGRDIKDVYGDYKEYVYAPIKGMTPAQAGILLDQSVQTTEMTAEMLELARRKYLKINKLGKSDFEFVKLKEPDTGLTEYQRYLLTELKPKLSLMKQKFSKQTLEFLNLVNQDKLTKSWYEGEPDKVRAKWVGLTIGGYFVGIWALGSMGVLTDGWLVLLIIISGIVSTGFAWAMPKRTLEGFKLYRQVAGLRYYLNLGKWRYENFEKNLFIEEVLPVAVALGVVDELAAQMKELGLATPTYASAMGNNMSGWRSFNRGVVGATMSKSSSGGWSGGSGFSGGSSGGGGGGGGGGSW